MWRPGNGLSGSRMRTPLIAWRRRWCTRSSCAALAGSRNRSKENAGMKHWLIMIGCAVLVVSGASAQQKKAVPPPPKPKDEGPSLEVTMKFIQDKVDGVGPVNYVEYVHDNTAGNDWTNKLRGQVSNIVAVASACRIAYHWKEERNGTVASDVQGGFSLKSVGDVVI